ncbi:hypothetical protein LTS18_005120 [Coniosporium uncinatum]|uniref:Uncharacterized protein n=1 Tax=Coniosporium uncinatum TaxID=93489 RepID=A0ACC3D548_9PEZI|nr:hypothetical protein LTS18_005120 [Coniosporium uncinatum]
MTFTLFMAQEPLKGGRPITDQANDPNKILMLGLRAQDETPKNMAFWELGLITQRFDARRQTIFFESDRKPASTWSQILHVCLVEISSINTRIQNYTNPPPPPKPASLEPQQNEIKSLPRIAQPPKEDNVFAAPPLTKTPRDALEAGLTNFAKSIGNSPNSPLPLKAERQKLLEYGSQTLLTDDRRAKLQPENIQGGFKGAVLYVIGNPYMEMFRSLFRSRATTVVCGSPYSRLSSTLYAIDALTNLTLASLKEDTYGLVQKDVATIVRSFATTIKTLDRFLKTLDVHWTDVGFSEEDRKKVPEVNAIVGALKDGLRKVLVAWGEYLDSVGLSKAEINEAKVLVREEPQMAERRLGQGYPMQLM